MHENTRPNPKKDKDARRRAKKTWKKAKATLREVHVVISRLLKDGRTRLETKKRLMRV